MNFGLFFVMQRPDHVSERFIYETELAQMVAADELGYHSVWIAEHHFSSFGVCSAPQVLAAAVAGQTKRLRVGMGITLLPLHDPVLITEELAVLDQVSGGRLEVGIGRASGPAEYSGFGIPFEESRPRVDEGIEILRGLWTQDRFSYQGTFRRVHEVTLVPKPRQTPHPPLYLASESPDTTPIAARLRLPMMTARLAPFADLVERHEIYRRVSAELGYPEAEVEARIAQTWNNRHVYVADDERAAVEDPKPHFLDYLQAIARRPKAEARAGVPKHFMQRSYEDYIREGLLFFGTPEQVVEKIGRFHEATGITNLNCFTAVRAMNPAKVLRSMELFAAKVMPHFKTAPASLETARG